MNNSDYKDEELTRELLNAIEQRSDVSQRYLAAKLGIALGLTNSYLKRCVKKGYLKIKEVPANRYLYFLTPRGFAEKSRLTARFLSTSLTFYRQSAESCSELFRLCEHRRWRNVMLCGASDLAEIAYTRSVGHRVEVVGVYDPDFFGASFLSLPARRHWERLDPADAYIVTGLADPLNTYQNVLGQGVAAERVLVPSVLGLQTAIQNGP